MATTTLVIDGAAVSFPASNAWPSRLSLRLRNVSTLTIVRSGGPPPVVPDPWLGKTVSLAIDGTTYFQGDVLDATPSFTGVGWVVSYQCLDLRNRGDRIPFTDSNTLTDSAGWNLAADDADWLADRAGRTVGEILTDALTMETVATALHDKGIGAYASLSPVTLPDDTIADLAALTLIPPTAVYIQGEKLLSAIESFVSGWAPNHAMWIRQSDGAIRFLDLRETTEHTFAACSDPIEPTPLSRTVAACYQSVKVRGMPIAEPKLLTLSSGGLVEDFGYGALSSAAAKAAYSPGDAERDADAQSQGTCTCTDTLNVVLTSTPASQTWPVNAWDQTNRLGVLYLWQETSPGVNQFTSRRVVANAAKTSGGTSSFTLDIALPATNFTHYVLYGVSSGAALVYRKYKVVDADIAAALTRQFTYPVPDVGANGDIVTMTSYPVGYALWSPDGNPPYLQWPIPFTFTSDGTVIFATPTYKMTGGHDPTDVRCLMAVNVGALTAVKPSSGYEGTSHSVEGMSDTLTVTTRSWRDPINQTAMEDYAQDVLDSVKDTVVEGEITYHNLFADALTFGLGASVAGSGYTTGWEGLNLPIVAVDLEWHSGSPWHHTTTMHVSNRRAHMTSGAYLKPSRPVGGSVGLATPPPARGQAYGGGMDDAGTGDDGTPGFAEMGLGADGDPGRYRKTYRHSSKSLGKQSSTPESRNASAAQHESDLAAARRRGEDKAAQHRGDLEAARNMGTAKGLLADATGGNAGDAVRRAGLDKAAQHQEDLKAARRHSEDVKAKHAADLEAARARSKQQGDTSDLLGFARGE